MRGAAGRPGGRITSHAAARTDRGSGAGLWRPLSVVVYELNARDSGSHFHAKIRLPAHSAAATSPGAHEPARAAKDPTTGPMTTPKLVAADSQPNALARPCAPIVSAT